MSVQDSRDADGSLCMDVVFLVRFFQLFQFSGTFFQRPVTKTVRTDGGAQIQLDRAESCGFPCCFETEASALRGNHTRTFVT